MSEVSSAASDAGVRTGEIATVGRMLFDLARTGDAARLVALVDQGVPVDLRDASGNSLLMMAAYYGHVEAVEELAGRGANVNLANDLGQTPLAGAVFKGHDPVVHTLLARGASPYQGAPSAVATAIAFGRQDLELTLRGLSAGAKAGKGC